MRPTSCLGLLLLGIVSACSSDGSGPEPTAILVTPQGGRVTSTDGRFILDVPAGSFDRETLIEIVADPSAPDSALLVDGTSWGLEPVSAAFESATITIIYDQDVLPPGVFEERLRIARTSGTRWVVDPASGPDPLTDRVSLEISEFGVFGIIGELLPGSGGEGVTVGPAGGTRTSTDGVVTLVFPPDAVSTSSVFTIQPASDVPQADLPVSGTIYEFGPAGFGFGVAVTIHIEYTEASIPPGADEASFQVHRLQDSEWVAVPGSTVDADANTASASVLTTGVYAIVGEPPEA